MKMRFFLSLRIKSLRVVSPNAYLLRRIRQALLLIQKTDRREYEKLFNCLKIIFITNRAGYTNEFFMPEKIWFANKFVILKNDIPWIASLILHEAFHATQFKKRRYVRTLAELEPPALNVQKRFLKKTEGQHGVGDVDAVAQKRYWAPMNRDKRSFEHFRKLLQLLQNKKLEIRALRPSRLRQVLFKTADVPHQQDRVSRGSEQLEGQ